MRSSRLALIAIAVLATACASQVKYQLQGSRFADPRAELHDTLMGAYSGCIAKPNIGAEVASVEYVCNTGWVGTETIRYSGVSAIIIESIGGGFRIVAEQKDGSDPVHLFANKLDTAERIADALEGLVHGAAAPVTVKAGQNI